MIKFRYKLLTHLVAAGYKVFIVAPSDEFVGKLEQIGCHHIDVKLNRKGINPIEDLLLIYDLYKIYKQINPDIIFNYSIKPIIYGSVAAKIANIQSIAVNIGLGYTFINTNIVTKVSHLLYRFALRFPTQVWFINEDDCREFIANGFVSQDKTLVLPSEGIDLEYFFPRKKKNNNLVFLLIARMLEDKGIVEYYKAAKIIKATFPEVTFWLLGDIDLENPKGIEEKVLLRWDSEGIVKYLGYAKDVREYIANSSCIVLPSYREGKGMTLIEAGSMQKPLIATNVEGCKDIVIDNYNGYLCKVRDSASLAEAFKKFICLDDVEKELFSKNSRKFVQENFDVNIVINIYMTTLQRIFY